MYRSSLRIFSVALLFLLLTTSAFSQAKKPTIMVLPSEIWCIRNNYTINYDDMGETRQIPDYKKALQNNSDMRAMIAAMADFMQKEGYPIKSLEQELKNLESEAAEDMLMSSKETGSEVAESPVDKLKANASPDIILDLDFEKVQIGPKTQIKFNLQAIDSYTGKIISGNVGQGTPSSAGDITNQLQEAVLSFKDNFLEGLMNHFNNLFTDGREIIVNIKRWSDCEIDFETEFGDSELGEILEDYMASNTVKGRFSTKSATENKIRFEQVRIPMMVDDGEGNSRAVDARYWGRNLVKFIKKTTGQPCKLTSKGLGEITIIMGGK